MKKLIEKIINITKEYKAFLYLIFATFLISFISIIIYKEILSQQLCKHAEYDFCQVKSYEIVIK